MSKVEHLEKIIEAYGPHLHDAPHGGWRADRVIDRVVPTHCPYCAVQCGMNLLVENNHVVGFEPRYDFPVNEGRLCPKGVTAYLQVHHPDRLLHPLIKRNGMFERAVMGRSAGSRRHEIQRAASETRQRFDWSLFGFFFDDRKDLPDGQVCARGSGHSLHRLQRAALHGLGCGGKQQGVWNRSRRQSMGRHSVG